MKGYPIELYELEDNVITISQQLLNNVYVNEEWYKFIMFFANDQLHPSTFFQTFFSRFEEREVLISRRKMNADYISENDYLSSIAEYIGKQIDSLFKLNNYKYSKMYDVLTAEYNPIWNVDGTEIRGYTKKNTGTQGNVNTKTGNITDNKIITYNGSEQIENGGTDTNVESGTITNNKNGTRTNSRNGQRAVTDSGTDTTTKSGNETRSTVPMESGTFYDTEKTTYNNVADGTTYGKKETETFTNLNDTETFNNYTDTQTFNAHQNQRTLNTTETKSFTNRNDTDNATTTFNNVQDNGTRTDNLKEEYDETLTRTGNIGVTKSQELIESELLLRAKYDFLDIVQKDIANYILYMS